MAYVYYIPPAPLPPVQERPSLCSPSRSTGFICGPVLIFIGGASALMIGFFERKPAIIWPIISCGVILCIVGVFLARRHVKHWRELEQERQRAMWRTTRHQPADPRRSVGEAAANPGFDVPMYCLEAPSRPLVPCSSDRTPGSSQYGYSPAQQYDNKEYWCALAVPLRPDDVTNGEYLEWTAMTLVVQPHFKYGQKQLPQTGATATAAVTSGDEHVDENVIATASIGAAAVTCTEASPGVLTRTMNRMTYSGYIPGADVADASLREHASEPTLSGVSVTLMRVPSLGSRSVYGSLHGGGGGGSSGRLRCGSRPGRMADLLSLFAAVTGNGGGGGDEVGGGGGGGVAAGQPEVDENGVELAGIKAHQAAVAAAAAAAAVRSLQSPPAVAMGFPVMGGATAAAISLPAGVRAADSTSASVASELLRSSSWRAGAGGGGGGGGGDPPAAGDVATSITVLVSDSTTPNDGTTVVLLGPPGSTERR